MRSCRSWCARDATTSSPSSRAPARPWRWRATACPSGRRPSALSKLDWSERERNAEALALHADLLRLRREDPVFAAQDLKRLAGAVLSPHALVLRYFGSGQEGDRLVLLNLGTELELEPMPGAAARAAAGKEVAAPPGF